MDVRYWVRIGKHLLAASISGFVKDVGPMKVTRRARQGRRPQTSALIAEIRTHSDGNLSGM
jgi:hypothetical protein